MFKNLTKEMAGAKITKGRLGELIGICAKSVCNKMSRKTEFTKSEMTAINGIFPDKTLEYLFDWEESEGANDT